LYTLVLVEVILPNPVLKNFSNGMKVVSWSPFTIAHQVHSITFLRVIKKESRRRLSNKWKKTLYRDCSHRIANGCATVLNILSKEIISNNTKCRLKQILKFIWNTWNYWWNETDDESLPLPVQFLWTLKLILPRFHGEWFSVLFQATIYILTF